MTELEDSLFDTRQTIGTDGSNLEDKPTNQQSVFATEKELYSRFSTVVLPHLGAALSLAEGLTGTHQGAQELLQQVFKRTLLEIGGATDDNPRAWVLTLVFCAWVDRDRKCHSRDSKLLNKLKQAAGEWGTEDWIAASGPDRQPDNGPLGSIGKLPAVFRETLLLRKLGMSYKKIAEIIDVPIGTVMSRLARARRLCEEVTANVQACEGTKSGFSERYRQKRVHSPD